MDSSSENLLLSSEEIPLLIVNGIEEVKENKIETIEKEINQVKEIFEMMKEFTQEQDLPIQQMATQIEHTKIIQTEQIEPLLVESTSYSSSISNYKKAGIALLVTAVPVGIGIVSKSVLGLTLLTTSTSVIVAGGTGFGMYWLSKKINLI